MKKHFKRYISFIMAIIISVILLPSEVPAQAAYTAPVDTIRIGLMELNSANLENKVGSGYELGYYTDDREFVSLGATISETQITMIVDRNMVYSSSSNSYSAGTTGDVVVGCFHIKLETAYNDYASARSAANTFTSYDAFVRYENSHFYVCVGEFLSADEASAAAAGLNIQQGYTIDSGSSYTVVVVATGTDDILFEFDCGSNRYLAVHPLSTEGKAQTWFKQLRYYGDFVYRRSSSGIYVINYVNIEDYVKGVIPYEMSTSWPIEAQKAGAITARTYAMANLNKSKHRSDGFDLCNTADCQVYSGTGRANSTSDRAVDETAGQYLMYNGELCETYYSSSNGGASESSENVWTTAIPYLRGVVDPYEADIADSVSNYYWEVSYTGEELASELRSAGYDFTKVVDVELVFTDVGNVKSITFVDSDGDRVTYSKSRARTFLGFRSQRYTVNGAEVETSDGKIYVNSSSGELGTDLNGLYAIGSDGVSQLGGGDVYAISGSGDVEKIDVSTGGSGSSGSTDNFVFTGSGWGHNVGMSQWGAYSMAKYHDKTCVDILTFYYTGAEVVTSN